jgi:hypothetical protein
MARPLSSSRALAPTLSGPQLAAVVNEVAASSPIAEVAVAQACKRQSDGIVRTRSGTLYSTAQFTFVAGAAAFAAGATQDVFNVPIGQAGSGFGAGFPLTKSQTNMTQAGVLASEAFSVDKLGLSISINEANGVESAAATSQMLTWLYNNLVVELSLGGQDVQLLGKACQWPDTMTPQVYHAGVAATASATTTGLSQSGYDALRDFELFIPQQVPFKVKLTLPQVSNFQPAAVAPTVPGFVEVCVSMYGTSVTAIQA